MACRPATMRTSIHRPPLHFRRTIVRKRPVGSQIGTVADEIATYYRRLPPDDIRPPGCDHRARAVDCRTGDLSGSRSSCVDVSRVGTRNCGEEHYERLSLGVGSWELGVDRCSASDQRRLLTCTSPGPPGGRLTLSVNVRPPRTSIVLAYDRYPAFRISTW